MSSLSTRSMLFCVAILLARPPASQGTTSVYCGLRCSGIRSPFSAQEIGNLKTILNFIAESPEFRPLTLSVILPEFRSSFVDILLRYIGENSIEAYKIRSRELSRSPRWMDRARLTWIIVVNDVYSLYIFIYWQPRLWKPGNQYLIFVTSKKVSGHWRNALKKLWKRNKVYRAVVIPAQDDFGCLIRFAPFEVRAGDFGEIRKLCLQNAVKGYKRLHEDSACSESCADNTSLTASTVAAVDPLQKDTRLFETFGNLNHYPLNVIVFESLLMGFMYDDQQRLVLTKVDGNVVYALEKALNCKFRLTLMKKLDFRREDPFDKSLREIEAGHVEIVITGFFVKLYTSHAEFQFTSSMYEDKLCFISPDSGLVPKAYMPFLPFEEELWALLMVYNVSITLLWCLLKYVNRRFQRTGSTNEESHTGNNEGTPARRLKGSSMDPGGIDRSLDSRGSLYGQPRGRFESLNRIPNSRADPPEVPRYLLKLFHFAELLCYPSQRGDTPAQRSLLVGTLFFGLIVNGVYQSCLVSSLSKPFHYPQLRTIEDVMDSGKTLITKYANLKTTFLDDTPTGEKFGRMIRVINTRTPTKDLVAFKDKIAITRYYTMLLGDYAYYDKDGNPLIYVVDECPMNYRAAYVLRANSPYAERVNSLLLRLNEGGLPVFWFQNMTYTLRVRKMRRTAKNEERKITLTMDHYTLTFALLLVGLTISALIFLGEVYTVRKARAKME
ncbi:uncharacterized protein LOC116423914 [Nomia melanderi]|uniref:uncharacterized protein LOC116423914 n=1 Tax=Nomia melanderi TaxID=2448451 RepID=UPI0013044DE0|nr:uncharacterized protein LOC116423914 [Nomia melanderi]